MMRIVWILLGILVVVGVVYYAMNKQKEEALIEPGEVQQEVGEGVIPKAKEVSSPEPKQTDREPSSIKAQVSPTYISNETILNGSVNASLQILKTRGPQQILLNAVNRLKKLGDPAVDFIHGKLDNLNWAELPQRPNYFYLLGYLQNDRALPIIDHEVTRDDERISIKIYKEQLLPPGIVMTDDEFVLSMLHDITDVMLTSNPSELKVTYISSRLSAVQALRMIESPASKMALLKIAEGDSSKLTTKKAIHLFNSLASQEERNSLLKTVSEERMRQVLSKPDFKRFYPNL